MTERSQCARCREPLTRATWDGPWLSHGLYPLCTAVYPAAPHSPSKVALPEPTPAPVEAPSEAYVVILPGETPRRFSTRLRALAYLLGVTS